MDAVLGKLLRLPDFLTEPVTWSVNMPFTLAEDWAVQPAVMAPVPYSNCFTLHDDGYYGDAGRQDPGGRELRPDSDWEVLRRGCVSVVRLDMREFGQRVVAL